ncbi:nitrositive-stress induced transcript [Histoplasma ohiense]|nr:nitrositive-stress induced transcript [Histoplasma ohiense (nom. inval.)]
MRYLAAYIMFISTWACLFAASLASPVGLLLRKTSSCPSSHRWYVKDGTGFPGKCVPVSDLDQQAGTSKIPNIERQRERLLGRKRPSQNKSKRNRILLGSDREKRQIIEEELPWERDPLSFFTEFLPTSLTGFPGPPQFTTTLTEDPFEEPFPSSAITSVTITITDAPAITSTLRTSLALPTPLSTKAPEDSERSKPDAGPIIAGCSIGGIALIAILYLAFVAWRRSRNNKREAELNAPPPPYVRHPLSEGGGPQTGFVAREVTQEIYPPIQARDGWWTRNSSLESPPDDVLGQSQPQQRRISSRYYAAIVPTDIDSNDSNNCSTPQLNSPNTKNRSVAPYTQTSNPSEPFTNLEIVTEESSHSNLLPTAPGAPHESAEARAAGQRTSYRSRRDSRDVVRRSLFGSLSSVNGDTGPEQGTTGDHWQQVSYQTPTNSDGHLDLSPIEPTDIDRFPLSRRRRSPPLSIGTPQRWPSNIRPNSPVSEKSFEDSPGPPMLGTSAPR